MHRQWTLPALSALGLLALVIGILLWPTPRLGEDWASGAFAVSVGSAHTCAVSAAGGLKCWGLNTDGQLGDGTKMQRTAPVDVTSLTSGVAAVTVGGGSDAGYHTCALTEAGGVKCWGRNNEGALGDGTTTNGLTPQDVCATEASAPCGTNLLSGAMAVSGGVFHTCAITTAGDVNCWGRNSYGQVGKGATESCPGHGCSTTPVDVVLGQRGQPKVVPGTGAARPRWTWCSGKRRQRQRPR